MPNVESPGAAYVDELILRGRKTDLREAVALAAGLRREVPDSRKDFLDLREAEALRALGGPSNRARARDLLATTRVEGIPGEHSFCTRRRRSAAKCGRW